ncbi:hypothetical protein FoTM2_009055 [Fusarium oxysporum f. sp. vasinfectum]|nr:hypothetical protein FoTM2_009055 [Fusarium oxysporum f. sp. vasinfectum]
MSVYVTFSQRIPSYMALSSLIKVGSSRLYPKANHKWACGLSQMGSHVRASNGRKLWDWTEEEINAYIDFSTKEEERVYHTVAGQARYTGRRGIEDYME